MESKVCTSVKQDEQNRLTDYVPAAMKEKAELTAKPPSPPPKKILSLHISK